MKTVVLFTFSRSNYFILLELRTAISMLQIQVQLINTINGTFSHLQFFESISKWTSSRYRYTKNTLKSCRNAFIYKEAHIIMLCFIRAISSLHAVGMLIRPAKINKYLAKKWSSFKRSETVGGSPRDSDLSR